MSEVLEQLELTIGSLGKDGCAEGLHDFLDGDILVRELIARGASRGQFRLVQFSRLHHSPNETKSSHAHRLQVRVSILRISRVFCPSREAAPYLEVISNVVPKIWARTNSAMMTVSERVSKRERDGDIRREWVGRIGVRWKRQV